MSVALASVIARAAQQPSPRTMRADGVALHANFSIFWVRFMACSVGRQAHAS